jgi:hypothetical protein
MRDQVSAWLGLQDTTSYNETQLIEDKLYQGTLDLLSRTRCTVRCVELNVQPNVDEYVLDHGILALVDMEDGARVRLRRDQNQEAAADSFVVVPPEGYGPGSPVTTSLYGFTLIRSDVLRIVPTPTENGQVQVWGVVRPQPMAQDNDSPGDEAFGAIPDEYQDAIVLYAMWKLADYSDDGMTQGGEYYRSLYEGQDGKGGRLGQIKMLINKRGTARAPRARVNLRSASASGSYI